MTIIQHKRGISSNWTSSDPVLAVSEIGYETDTGKFKIGDGASAWSALPYFSTSSGGSGTVTSITAGTGLSGGTITTSGTIALSHLGIESLTDPNADRILFWDDSASSAQWLTLGTNLSISGTTINASDTNTTYTAGTGLTLSGTEFSVTANTYQPLDADLTAIAALSANGLLRKTAGTWGMDTATYLTSYTETDTLSDVTGRGATTNTAISITNATSSTNTTTGALKVTGGVGVQENLNVGGNVIVTGDLTVNGTTTTINSTIVTVDDPIFTLGGDTAPGSDDNKDRGIAFRWHNGVSAKIGFFGFDDSTQYFTFVPDATITNEVISGSTGTISANLNGNATSADTATTATTATDATSADTVKTVATGTNASFYPTFVDANNGTATSESVYTDAGLVYNPSSNTLTIGGDLAINGGDLTSSSTTFNMLTGTVTTLNFATGATTAINIGSGSGGTLTLASPNITLSGFSGSTGLVKSTAGVLSIDTSTYLTSSSTLTAGNLSGTIPAGVLGNSSLYVGTTSIALNRSSTNLALTGITSLTGGTGTTALTLSSADTSGAASGAVSLVSGEATSSTAGTVKVDSGNNGTPGSGGANVSIGTTNASSITIGRTGITTTIAGTLSATVSNATNATTATNATNINISTTDGNTSDTTMYPVFVAANTTGNQSPHTDVSGIVYNASTDSLSLTGDLTVTGGDVLLGGTGTATTIKTLATTGAASGSLTISTGDTTSSGTSGNITIDVGNGATGDGTISIGDTYASAVTIGAAASTVTIGAATGNVNFNDNISAEGYITARRASNQDSVRLLGRAGGTGNYDAILTPTTLTASRTITIPDATGTMVLTSGATFTGQIISTHSSTWTSPAIDISGTQPAIIFKDTDASAADAIIGVNAGSFFVLGDTASDGTYDTQPLSINLTSGATTFSGDVAVNGGDLTTTSTGTATLFNTNATTLNIGGAATTISMGASNSTLSVPGTIKSTYSSGSEGGEFFLAKPASGTTIDTGVAIDIYQNKFRIFESGGTGTRGYYLDITDGASGAGTNLKPPSYMKIIQTSTQIANLAGGTAGTVSAFGTNGVALKAATAYEVEMVLLLESVASSNSCTLVVTPGSPSGPATPSSSEFYYDYSSSTTVVTNAAALSGVLRTGTTTFPSLNTITIATGTTNILRAFVKGIVDVSTAGNFTFRLAYTPGAGGSLVATILRGSYLKITELGTEDITDIGTWA